MPSDITPRQIELIRASHARLAPQAEAAGRLFYRKLFSLAPELQPLFIGDVREQATRLMQMIGAAVGLLDRPQQLMPVLQHLGARHAGYGVRPRDYQLVGLALLDTLAEQLGAGFDAETRSAWAGMYGLVSSTMIAAARAEAAPNSV